MLTLRGRWHGLPGKQHQQIMRTSLARSAPAAHLNGPNQGPDKTPVLQRGPDVRSDSLATKLSTTSGSGGLTRW